MVLHPNDDEALFSLVAPHGRLLLRASVVAVIAHVFKVVFVIHVVVFVFVFAANDDTTPTAATLVVRRVAVVKVVVIMLAKVLVVRVVVVLRLNKKNLLLFSYVCNSFGVRRFTTTNKCCVQ